MLNLALSLAASTVLLLVCAAMAYQLRTDRPTPPLPRHSLGAVQLAARPISAPPAPVQPPKLFDPLDADTPIDEVERFLADLQIREDDTRELERVA